MFLFCSLTGFNQETTEQVNFNGKNYFIYPYPVELESSELVDEAVRFSLASVFENRRMFKDIYEFEEPEMTGGSRRDFRKERRKFVWGGLNKSASRALIRAVRANSDPLFEPFYQLEKDITPSLDPLPDGEYIQYFSGYFKLTKRGKIDYNHSLAAGIFTLKNNTLVGKATWLSIQGDTLKTGVYVNGMKEGVWYLEDRRAGYEISSKSKQNYIRQGVPLIDTIREYVTFKGGSKEGHYSRYENSIYPILEGNFVNNENKGTWIEREVQQVGYGKRKHEDPNNALITTQYTYANQPKAVKQVFVRNWLIRGNPVLDSLNFMSKYPARFRFIELYEFDKQKNQDDELELEEERAFAYAEVEGDYAYEEEYYSEEYGEEDEYSEDEGDQDWLYDENIDDYVDRSKFRDSLGVKFLYAGTYEVTYPNGQRMLKLEFNDGRLVKEDTVFWDNGNVYDVVNFIPDSNQYFREVFDYDGVKYCTIKYDSTGKQIAFEKRRKSANRMQIEGYSILDEEQYSPYIFYDATDTLNRNLTDSLVIFRAWQRADTSLVFSRSYNPKLRSLSHDLYSITGCSLQHGEFNFTESFEGWTGSETFNLGNIQIEKVMTGTMYDEVREKIDTIDSRVIKDYMHNYRIADEQYTYVDGKLFTGDISINMSRRKFAMSAGNRIEINFPQSQKHVKRIIRQFNRYNKDKHINRSTKTLFSALYAYLLTSDYCQFIYRGLLEEDFLRFSKFNFQQDKKDLPRDAMTRIEGSYKDGRPNGTWKIYGRKNILLLEVPYQDGFMDGTVRSFAIESPKSNDEEMDYYMEEMNPELMDSVPNKPVYYQNFSYPLKKGQIHGEVSEFNWLGQCTSQANYVDGFKHGRVIERNKIAYSICNYENGMLDGYYKTYLTLPGKDSVLLYDLNFQDDQLQGESRGYHLNGKLAKRGFFLNGQPIEDYEAFDTLGIKYQYVKFKYGFPVEEKIWEENQLSVRYSFDWKDSVEFVPYDITSSETLEDLLPSLGIGLQDLENPYYGRPSLIDKEALSYHITKYFPNDTVSRDGQVKAGKKIGLWKYYDYYGEFLYEVNYFDTLLVINDSIKFKAKGILTDYNKKGDKISESYVIEKFEKYDCSHSDHYEIRQLKTIWQKNDTVDRMNGFVRNYYDNGVLQNEGKMKDGLPTGVWKFYDPYGKLTKVGNYVMGKRDGRWLSGDLAKSKYLGEICLNPNLPNLEEEMKYREHLIDIQIVNYKLGIEVNKEYYNLNLNEEEED